MLLIISFLVGMPRGGTDEKWMLSLVDKSIEVSSMIRISKGEVGSFFPAHLKLFVDCQQQTLTILPVPFLLRLRSYYFHHYLMVCWN